MCNKKSVEIGRGVLVQGSLFQEFNLKKITLTHNVHNSMFIIIINLL